jgi:hypothetical protein
LTAISEQKAAPKDEFLIDAGVSMDKVSTKTMPEPPPRDRASASNGLATASKAGGRSTNAGVALTSENTLTDASGREQKGEDGSTTQTAQSSLFGTSFNASFGGSIFGDNDVGGGGSSGSGGKWDENIGDEDVGVPWWELGGMFADGGEETYKHNTDMREEEGDFGGSSSGSGDVGKQQQQDERGQDLRLSGSEEEPEETRTRQWQQQLVSLFDEREWANTKVSVVIDPDPYSV